MAYKHYKYFVDPPHLMQFACFQCRKSYKQRLSFVRLRKHSPLCPECSAEMWEMGRQFKAPKQSDVKQWRKVEALVRNGITFHSQRLSHMRPMPKVLREVVPFIQKVRRRSMSEGEKLLARVPRRRKQELALK